MDTHKSKTTKQVKQCLQLCDKLEELGVYKCLTDSIRREVRSWLGESHVSGGGNPAWDHFVNCGHKWC